MGREKKIFDSFDARRISRSKLPKLIFDFIEGATGREIAAKANVHSFERVKLLPRALIDVSERSLSTSFMGGKFCLPFGIAPMGMCNLAYPNADILMAKIAKERNFPHCIATATSTNLEEVYSAGEDKSWFQLYVLNGPERGLELAKIAQSIGYKTLILTVDVPQAARRLRELRNGFNVPFKIGMSQFIDFAIHPVWSIRTLSAGIPKPVLFQNEDNKFERTANRMGADWDFLNQLRSIWDGKIIVKGILSIEDAKKLKSVGIDGIWVSNHGGRQLDGAPAPINILPLIRGALGKDFPIAFDSGLRDASDIVKALASGADFTFLGRPILHSLAAAGKAGLEKILSIFTEELYIIMAQIGVKEINEIDNSVLAGSQE